MEKICKRVRIVSENESQLTIKVYDKNGNDIADIVPIRNIAISLDAVELNKAILTLDNPTLDIKAEAFFQLGDGRPVIDLFKSLKSLIDKYEVYNEEQGDKAYHTDCLDDFYNFALRAEEKVEN